MKSLDEIIAALDQQLAYAEKTSGDSSAKALLDTKAERTTRYVLVKMGQQGVAIPIGGLAEIGHLPPVTSLPNLPKWIEGIVNLRGEIVSVVDLLAFLALGETGDDRDKRLAVLQSGKIKVGVLVDRIIATINHPDSELRPHSAQRPASRSDVVFRHSLTMDQNVYNVLGVSSLLNLKSLRNYYESEA